MRIAFYIFRHGETDWNREERFQGHIDIPLNAVGVAQANRLVNPLRRVGIQSILSSDLSRALRTAQIVAESLAIPITVDPKLREANLGRAQGKTRLEIESEFGAELALRWRSSHVSDGDIAYPDGETGNAIIERVFSSLGAYAEQHAYSSIGVATHGGVIRRIFQKIYAPDPIWVPIPNGVLYRIEYDRVAKTWAHGDYFTYVP